jgi:YD repeat-containing protein
VAQNLLAKTETKAAVPAITQLPLDTSGRNRPASANGVPLQWDHNGNLIQKGNLRFAYDFRNRLTDVTDPSGNAVAHYDYDAFNRRIAKTLGADVRTTLWQGWRPIEDYDGTRLLQRRTYGDGLDDIVYLESDLDGTGNVAAKSWPLYDSTGNLVLLTTAAGLPLERYAYTPYGGQTILVNSTPPAVQQVRVVGSALWVELSEPVLPGPLSQAATAGTLALFDNTRTAAFSSLAVAQPITTGDLALRRLVLTAQPPAAFQPGDQVTLTLPAAALVDSFLNQPAQPYTLTFTWPAADAVVADLAAPLLERLSLQQGHLSVELSVEPNQTTATAAIQLDGAPLAWTLSADHYTLESTTALAAGAHTLTIATTLTDLGGQSLATPVSQSFTTATPQDTQALSPRPTPR